MRPHHARQRTLVSQRQRRIPLRGGLPREFLRVRSTAQETEVGETVQLGVGG